MLSSTTHPLDRNGEYEILCPFHMSSLRNGSTFVEHERDHVVENELMIHHGGVDASTSHSASTMSSSTNHSWLAVFEEEDYHFGEHYVVKRPLDREELLGLGGENQDPSSEFVDIVM
ncbi:hypothetical protein C9374_006269 [Naegleria lovaniensis]|uniref:Uncharacterized protein n=1 Tax=Naegleria lovaniensis TaxID=51637 RepID=A0AA88GJH2_NAELO|nr:uncharacterized protein C9374_006269 [Naegleria lovaniensis]KAG2381280.1 hypothetical protein C9374_006269 [Naegleria lovaniensis]